MQERDDSGDSRDEQRDVELAAKEIGEMLADSQTSYIEATEGRVVGKQERNDMVRRHIEDAVVKLPARPCKDGIRAIPGIVG